MHFGDIWRYLEHSKTLVLVSNTPHTAFIIKNIIMPVLTVLLQYFFDGLVSDLDRQAISANFVGHMLESCNNWMCWLTVCAKYHFITRRHSCQQKFHYSSLDISASQSLWIVPIFVMGLLLIMTDRLEPAPLANIKKNFRISQ